MALNIQLEGERQININGNNVKQEKINIKADDKNVNIKALKDKDLYIAHYDGLDNFMQKLMSNENKLSVFDMLKNDAIEYDKINKNSRTRVKRNKKNLINHHAKNLEEKEVEKKCYILMIFKMKLLLIHQLHKFIFS